MKKIVKVGWVLWFSFKRYPENYNWKTRMANAFQIVWRGYSFTIGLPYAKAFVKYEVLNSFGKSTKKIEEEIENMLKSPGFKIKMPKIKYSL